MTTYTFSREDIESLSFRMESKAWSPLFIDMPETRRDIRSAAALLKFYTSLGIPVSVVEIEIFNGII